ncbi:hypothetical protein [Streptomyces sp. NPDC006739]|uniref:hypothetical protein n=1 Tax=Streptomyces sp. NPDC006739 TaxID=3364763 RepID=UPI0036C62ED4
MSPTPIVTLTGLGVSRGRRSGPGAHLRLPPRLPAHEQPAQAIGAKSQRVVEVLGAVARTLQDPGELL